MCWKILRYRQRFKHEKQITSIHHHVVSNKYFSWCHKLIGGGDNLHRVYIRPFKLCHDWLLGSVNILVCKKVCQGNWKNRHSKGIHEKDEILSGRVSIIKQNRGTPGDMGYDMHRCIRVFRNELFLTILVSRRVFSMLSVIIIYHLGMRYFSIMVD